MPSFPQTLDAPSSLGLAVWRLLAGSLYGLALLLISHDLRAAVFTMVAALLCLPGTRAALLQRTGVRLGSAAIATGAGALILGAILSAGQSSALAGPVAVEVGVATVQVEKP